MFIKIIIKRIFYYYYYFKTEVPFSLMIILVNISRLNYIHLLFNNKKMLYCFHETLNKYEKLLEPL